MEANILDIVLWLDACIVIRMEIKANPRAKPLFLIMGMVVAMVANMIAGLDPTKEPQCLTIHATIDPCLPHLVWLFNQLTWMRK